MTDESESDKSSRGTPSDGAPDMPDQIPPALDEREWALLRRGHVALQCYDSWDEEVSKTSGVAEVTAGADYLTLTSHQHPDFADFSAPADRHALAALCLYGQPFGFDAIDLASVGWAIRRLDKMLRAEGVEFPASVLELQQLRSLASRIAALLPPPSPERPT